METSKESSGVDKQGLWGWWHKHQQWSDNLHRKAAHKALDIEDDSMIVSQRGISAGGVIGIVLAALIPTIIAAGLLLWQGQQDSAPSEAKSAAPVNADYEVRFYDAQGNEVRLDRWPGHVR